MAYNTWGPSYSATTFGPYGPQQQSLQYTQNSQTVPPVQQPQQIQNGGFVIAPSEEFARNYPVAPGTKVTFKDENQPYLYTKMAGFSLLDQPVFEKFKLIKEGEEPTEELVRPSVLDGIMRDLSTIKKDLDTVKEDLRRRNYPDKRKGEKND